MSDLFAATQLPLFEEEELLVKPKLPTRWDSFGRTNGPTLLTDLANVNLHAVASPRHRDSLARKDNEREKEIESIAVLSGTTTDDVWAAYANYCNGRLSYEIFEDFAEMCSVAIRAGLIKAWFKEIASKSSKNQSAKQIGLFGGKILQMRKSQLAPLSVLISEPGLSNVRGGGIFATSNTKTLDRENAEPREFPRRQPK